MPLTPKEIQILSELSTHGDLFDRSYIKSSFDAVEDESGPLSDILYGIYDLQNGKSESVDRLIKAFEIDSGIIISLLRKSSNDLYKITDDNIGFFKVFALKNSASANNIKQFLVGQFRQGYFNFDQININEYGHIWDIVYKSISSESDVYGYFSQSVYEIPRSYDKYYYDSSYTKKFKRLLSIMFGLLQEGNVSIEYLIPNSNKKKTIKFDSEREMEDWIAKESKKNPNMEFEISDRETNEETQYAIVKSIDSLMNESDTNLREFSARESFMTDSISAIKKKYKKYVGEFKRGRY